MLYLNENRKLPLAKYTLCNLIKMFACIKNKQILLILSKEIYETKSVTTKTISILILKLIDFVYLIVFNNYFKVKTKCTS